MRAALVAPTTNRNRRDAETLGDQRGQALLEDRDLALRERAHTLLVEIGAGDRVAEARQARGRGEPHVPRADDRDLAHGQSLTYSVTASRQGRSDGRPARRSARLSSALIGGRAAGRSRSAASMGATPDGSTPRARNAVTISSWRVHRLAAAGDVEQPLAPLHREARQQHREIGRVGGDAHLVGEHAVELTPVEGAERPAHEVGAAPAEHPRGADGRPRRRVAFDLELPAELRTPVLRDRVHRVPLVVGAGRLRRRTRSRWTRARGAHRDGRSPGRACARRARSREARSGSRSQASTLVIAAAFTTASGANSATTCSTCSRSARSSVSRAAPSTSWCPSRASTTRAPT